MPAYVWAQLQVTHGPGGAQILNSLNGGGMVVSNITLNCPDTARALFNGTSSNIGLNNGVLLSTGHVINAQGPNNTTYSGTCQQLPSGRPPDEPDLTGILNTYYGPSPTPLTRDACILEFDVKPGCDTLRISFVFASEEYPEYIGTGFSDAMGIFVSGPGITGSPNIATLPTNTPFANPPILVDYVNQFTNSGLFVNNIGGLTVQYDGFTVKLTAKIHIPNVCGTYHVKIAIADGYDCFLDSGIFLEQGSLFCNYNRYEVTTLVQDARRGCSNGVVNFTRYGDTTSVMNIPYTIAGDAVNGQDYQTLSGTLTFPANTSSTNLNIASLLNGNPSGTDTVRIIVSSTLCGTTTYDTAVVYIHPANLARAGNDTTVCQNQSVTLGTSTTGGYTYNWTPSGGLSSSVISNPVFTPSAAGVFSFVVQQTDNFSCIFRDTVFVTVQAPVTNNVIGSAQTICTGQSPTSLTGTTPVGGSGVFVYQWQSSSNNSSWTNLSGQTNTVLSSGALTTTTYFRRQVNSGACVGVNSNSVQISVLPSVSNNLIGTSQTICSGAVPSGLTGSIPTGGSGSYSYIWESSTNNSTWGSIPGALVQNYAPPVSTVSLYYRRVVNSGSCTGNSNVVFIQADTQVSGNTLSTQQTICQGSAPSGLSGAVLSGGNGVYVYQWQSSTDFSVWNSISGASVSTYSPPTLNTSVYYRRVVNSGVCSASTSVPLLITVSPSVSNNVIGSAQTVCSGSIPTSVTGALPGGGSGVYTYTWQSSTDNSSWSNISGGNGQNAPVLPSISQTIYLRRQIISGVCSSVSNTVVLSVIPGISNNIVGNQQTICTGGLPAQFTGTTPAGGNGLFSYQWQSSSNNSTWVNINNETGQNYLSGSLTNTLYLRRLVSSGVCQLVAGNTLTLQVEQNISNNTITQNQTICTGFVPSMLSGSLPAGGSGNYTYQWQSSTDNINWTQISGGTGINFSPGTTHFQTYYQRIVNGGLCPASLSNSIIISADPVPGNNIIGSLQTICQGNIPLQFTGTVPTGGNGNYLYQWQSSTDQVSWNPVPSGNTQNYQASALTSVTYYRRIVSAGSCPALTSSTIIVQITLPITNNTILGTQTICQGGVPVQITGTTPGGGDGIYQYIWQSSLNNSTWTNINSSTTSSYTPEPLNTTTYFRRLITSGACSSTSNSHIITVNPGLGAITVGSSQTICLGAVPSQLTGTLPTGGSGVYTYQWQSSTDNSSWSNVPLASSQNYSVPAPVANIYYRRLVSSGACTNVAGNNVPIAVVATPGNNTIQNSQTICGGEVVQLTGSLPTGGTGVYSFVWEISSDNVNWFPATGGTGQNFVSSAINTLTYFRRVLTAPPCPANSSAAVAIQPIPAITNNTIGPGQTLCIGGGSSQFTGTIPGGGTGSYTYAWDSSSDGSTWFVIAGQTSLNYTPPTQTQTTYFRRRVLSGSCNIPGNTVAIVVEQVIGNNFASSSQTICTGQPASGFTGSNPTGGSGVYAYQWQVSTDNSSWSNIPSATFISYAPPTPVVNTYYRRIVSGSLCAPSTSASVSIILLPTITANTVGSNQTICNGTAPLLLTGSTPLGGNGVYAYQWQSSSNNLAWVNLTGETGINYGPPILNNIAYYRRIASSSGCSGVNSNSVIINVQGGITNNQIISNQTICSGSVPTPFFGSFPAGGTGVYVYQWHSSTDNSTWVSIPSATTSNYSSGILTQTTFFIRSVSSGLCPPNSSTSLTVSVNPPVGNNITGTDQTICAGTQPTLLTGTLPTGGTGVYTYIWQSSTNNSTWLNIGAGGLGVDYQPPVLSSITYFRRQVTSASCTPSLSTALMITTLPALGNNIISSSQTICRGNIPAGFTGPTPTGGTGIYGYQWQFSADSLNWTDISGATLPVYASSALFSDTYFRRSVISGPCTTLSNPIRVYIELSLGSNTIQADQSLCAGSNVTPLVGTTPSGGSGIYNYQWQSSTNTISWGNIPAPGGTASNYNPGLLNTSLYFRRVVSSGPCAASTSNFVRVVIDPAIGNNHLVSNQTICLGVSASTLSSFAPTGGNGSYLFQWESSATALSWTPITGATNLSYSPGILNATQYYRRTIISGACFSMSDTVIVVINQLVGRNTIQANQTICFGQFPQTFTGSTPTGGTGVYSFQWQFSPDSISFFNIPGETNQNYASSQLFASTYFRRLVISGVCPPIPSDTVLIFVNPPVSGNIISTNQTVCLGEMPTMLTGTNPSGGTGTYTYDWESSTNQTVWLPVTGNNTPTHTPGSLVVTTYFRRIVSSPGCTASTSNIVSVTMVPGLTNNTIGSSQTLCEGNVPSGFNGSNPSGGSGTYTYQWESSTVPGIWLNMPGITQQNYAHTGGISTMTYFRRIVYSGFCVNTSSFIQVTTQSPIGNNIIISAQSICSGVSPTRFTGTFPTGGSGIYSYQWQSSLNNVSFTNISGATQSDYQSPALSTTVYFRRVISGGACPASTSQSIAVTVQSGIMNNLLLSNQTVCSGNLPAVITGLNPMGGSGIYSYQWQSSANNSTWVSLPGEVFQNLVPPLLSGSVYYRRATASGVCADTSVSVVVVLNQGIGNTSILSDQTLCAGTGGFVLTGFVPSGGNGTFTYQWQSSTDQISWFASTGGVLASYTLPVLNTTTYFRRVTASPPCPAQTSNTVQIQIFPPPLGNLIGNSQTICAGAQPSLMTGTVPSGGTGIYSMTWQSSSNNTTWSNAGTGQDLLPPIIFANTYYRRVLSSGPCTALTSTSISIAVVTPLGNNIIGPAQTLCSGNPYQSITGPVPTGGSGLIAYQWESSPDGVSWFTISGSTLQNLPGGSVTSTSYFRRLVTATPCVSLSSNNIAVIIDTNIGNNTISAQQSICTGSSLVLSGGVPSGGNGVFTYQWNSSPDNISWSGSLGTSIDITVGPLSSNTYFRRIVFSGLCAPSTSTVFAVTVEPNVGSNSLSATQTICAGSTSNLITGSIPTGGNGQFIYSWESSVSLPAWNIISGETGINYQPGVISGLTYIRRVVRSAGVCPGSSISAQIIIDAEPQLGNNITGNSQTICIGQAPFSLSGSLATGGSGGISYIWEVSFDNINWSGITGATNQSYNPPTIFGATYYRRIATGAGVCPPVTSATIDIIPITPISNNSIAVAQTVCSGNAPQILTGSLPSGGNGIYTYQWQTSFDNINWLNAPGATGIHYSAPPVFSMTYYRRVVGAGTCSNASNVQVVTVLPSVGNNTISFSQTLCMGISPATLTGPALTGGTGTYTYLWQSSTDNNSWSTIGGSSTSFYTPSQIAGVVYYRRLSTSGACSNNITNVVQILMDSPISNNILLSSSTLCQGSTMSLTGSLPSGGNGQYFYQWESSSDNSAWTLVAGGTQISYSTGTLNSNVYYRRIIGSGICPGSTSASVAITVHPTLGNNQIGNSQTLCSGNIAAVLSGSLPTGGNGVFNYTWQSSPDLVNWFNVPGTTSYAPGIVTASVYYRRYVTSGACNTPDTSSIIQILSDPPIALNSISSNQSVCTGQIPPGILGSVPSGGTGTYTFIWESSSDNSSWAVESTGTVSNYVPVPLNGNTYFRRIVQSGACPPLTSNVIIYHSIPGIFNNLTGPPQALCTGSVPLALTGSIPIGGTGTFTCQWHSSSDSITWNVIPGGTQLNQAVGNPVSSVYYRRVVFSGTCQDSSDVLIRIDNLITGNTIFSSQTICQFTSPLQLSGVLPSGGNGQYQYQWESSTDNVSWNIYPGGTSQNLSPNALSSHTYFRRIISAGPCPASTSASVLIQIQPAISNNQIGNSQTLCSGQVPSNLTGSVPGGGIGVYGFQWESSLDNSTWINISGSTGLNQIVGTVGQSLYYRRVVNSGVCVTPSNTVIILAQPPIGNNQIGNFQTICVGTSPSTLTGMLPSGGTGTYTYQWQSSTNNSTWVSLPTGTVQDYNSGPITTSYYFRRVLSSGFCQDTSSSVLIEVFPTISRNFISINQTICNNQIPALLLGTLPQGGTGVYSYAWESSTDNSTWTSISGGTLIDYQPSIVGVTTYFRRKISSGPCDNLSAPIIISVVPPIGNNLLIPNQTICTGAIPSPVTGVLPTGGSGVYTYSWLSSANNSLWSQISGETGSGYTSPALTQSLYLRRIVNSGLCADTSSAFVILVHDSISNNSILPSQTICESQLPANLVGSLPLGGGGTFTYQWQSSTNNVNWFTISGASLQNFLPPIINQNIYYRRIVSGSECPASISSSVVVEVNPLIGNNQIGASQTLCSGNQPSVLTGLIPTGGSGQYQYVWLSSTNGNSWQQVSGGTGTTYLPPLPSQTIYYRRMVISGFCSPDSGNTVIIQADSLVGNNFISSNQALCSGQIPQLIIGSIPTGGSGNVIYIWQSSSDSTSWSNISGASQVDYQSPVVTSNIYFRRIVSKGLCPSDTSTAVSLSVQPSTGNNSISSSQTLCSGSFSSPLTGSLPTGGSGIYTYVWQSSSNHSSWTTIPGETLQNYSPGSLTQTVYYQRLVTSGICPSDTSQSLTILIQPSITSNVIGNAETICAGSAPTLLTGSLPTGGTGSYVYQWQSSLNSSNWVVIPLSDQQNWGAGTLNQSTYFRRIITSGSCSDSSAAVLITVRPTLGNNLIGADQTLCAGQSAVPITGTVPSGAGGVYQYVWESSTNNTNWNIVSGGTNQSYQPGILANTTYFRRIVSSTPCAALTSTSVQISVYPILGNNQISTSQTTICSGSTPPVFTGTAPTGGNGIYTYQWLSASSSTGPWVAISGETNMNYASGGLNANTYFRRIAGSLPCQDTSSIEAISVTSGIGNNIVGAGQTICQGSSPQAFTGTNPTGGSGVYAYQWESSSNNINWVILSGQTSAGMSSGILHAVTYFRRVVTAGPCPSSTSNVLRVQVDSLIGNNSIQASETICSGNTPQVLSGSIPTGGNGSYLYQWLSSTNNSSWTVIPGESNQNFSPGSQTQNVYYRRRVQAGVCLSDTSSFVLIDVVPVIQNNTIAVAQTVCANVNPNILTGSLPNGGTGVYQYQWQSGPNNTNWVNINQATQQDHDPGSLIGNVYFRRIVSSNACVSSSQSIMITIDPVIGNNTLLTNQTVCTGQVAPQISGSLPTGGNGQSNYIWQSGTDNSTWVTIVGSVGQSHFPGPVSVNTYFRRIVVSPPCASHTSVSVYVAVIPVVGNNTLQTDQTICTGQLPAQISGSFPTGGSGAYTYQWVSSATPNGPWVSIVGEVQQDYTPGGISNSTYFRRIVLSTPCQDTSSVVQVIVNPGVGNNSVTNHQTLCSGSVPSPLSGSVPSGGNGNYIYQWESSPDGFVWSGITGASTQNYSSGSLSSTTYFRRVVTAGPCPASTSNVVQADVNPFIGDNNLLSDQTICSGVVPPVFTGSTPSGGNLNYQYQWQDSPDNLNWSNITGAVSQNYTSGALVNNRYFRRIVSAGICAPDTSVSVLVLVNPVITGNTILQAQTICQGIAPSMFSGSTPGGGTGLYVYQWQTSTNNSSWNDVPNETQQDYTSGILMQTTYFRREVTSGACVVNSLSIQVTVLPLVGNNIVGNDQTICTGQAPQSLTGAIPTGGNGLYTYAWESSPDSLMWTAITGTNTTGFSPGILTSTAYYRRTVSGGPCAASTSSIVMITVSNGLSNNILSTNQTICTGTTPTQLTGLTPAGGSGVYAYQWLSSLAPTGPWVNISGETQSSYTPSVLVNSVYYRRYVSGGPCSDTSAVLSVLVNVAPGNNFISQSQTICVNTAPATFTGSVPTGGNGNYIYSWESSNDNSNWSTLGSGTGQNFTSGILTQNTYFRRVVQAGPCAESTSQSVQVSIDPVIGDNITGSDQTICSGSVPSALTGSVPTGGNGNYLYTWQSSTDNINWTSTGGNMINFAPGTLTQNMYFRRLVSAGSCAVSTSSVSTITVEPGIGNNLVLLAQTICSGSLPSMFTGTLPSGGNGSYTYQWQSSPNSNVWTNIAGAVAQDYSSGALNGNVYFRRYVNSGLCSDTSAFVMITVNPQIGNNLIGSDQTLCAAQNAGLITGTAPTGGNGVYQYVWETSTDNMNWLPIGNGTSQNLSFGQIQTSLYFRRVVISGPCAPVSSQSVVISVYPTLGSNQISSSQTICAFSAPVQFTGSLPTGGTGIYTYQWQSGTSTTGPWVNITGAVNPDYTSPSLLNRTYFRRVLTSLPCSDTSNVISIDVNPLLSANTIGVSQTICLGFPFTALTGSTPNGGNGQYVYSWQSSSDNVLWVGTGIVSQNYPASIPAANEYYRRVVSAGVCASITSSAITIVVEQSSGNNQIGNDQTICANRVPQLLTGSLPTGGSGMYTYIWETSQMTLPLNWAVVAGVSGQNYQPSTLTQTLYYRRRVSSGVCPGLTSSPVVVWVDPAIGNNVIGSSQTICASSIPGMITGSLPTGGNSNYAYQWQSSSNNMSWTNMPGEVNNAFVSGPLNVTTYFRRVVSAGLCDASSSQAVMITVNQLVGNNSISADATICSGQSPSQLTGTTPSGGSGSYTYQWQSSADQLVWTNVAGSAAYSVPALSSNIYFRRVVSSGACSSQTSNEISVTVLDAIGDNTIGNSQTLCAGQTPSILTGSAPSGGSIGFTYQWESSTDAINWTLLTGASTQDYLPGVLNVSTYFRRGVSSGPCQQNSNQVLIRINQVPVISVNDTSICIGNTVTLTATSDVPGGIFTWNVAPFNTSSVTVSPVVTTTYSVDYITGGCVAASVYPVVTVNSMPNVRIMHTDSVIFCDNTTVTLNALPSGASYEWTQAGMGVIGTDSSYVVSASGTYIVKVTDVNGCSGMDTLVLTKRPPLVVQTSGVFASCAGGNDGIATVTVAGGTAPYTYIWSEGSTTATLYGLASGMYSVLVEDALGCMETSVLNLVDPAAVSGTISGISNVSCFGKFDGSLTVSPSGGTPPYTYSWSTSPVQNGPTARNLGAGSYTVLITDANGCFTTIGGLITQPVSPVVASITPPLPHCPGEVYPIYSNGTGGTGPYTYSWSPASGLSNPNIQNPFVTYSVNTSYTVTVTDSRGCKDSHTELVQAFAGANAEFRIIFVNNDSTLYNDEETNIVNLSTPSGMNYVWDFGDGVQDTAFEPKHMYSSAGTYVITLIAETKDGCRDTTLRPLRYKSVPNIYVPTAFSPNGDGVNDFFRIAYLNLRNFNVFIFDRWGNKLYQSQDPAFRWDGTVEGKPLPEGVYTVYLKGIGSREDDIEYSGTVTLIR